MNKMGLKIAPGHPPSELPTDWFLLLFGVESPDRDRKSLCSSISIRPVRNMSIDDCPSVRLHQRSHCISGPRRLTCLSACRRWGAGGTQPDFKSRFQEEQRFNSLFRGSPQLTCLLQDPHPVPPGQRACEISWQCQVGIFCEACK